MKIKKGTDVIEVRLEGCDESYMIKSRSTHGQYILKALESVVGSPALDDSVESCKAMADSITISRYRLKEDVKLVQS